MTGLITTRREDALFFVGLNRPEKRNAIHRDLLLELTHAMPLSSSTLGVLELRLQSH